MGFEPPEELAELGFDEPPSPEQVAELARVSRMVQRRLAPVFREVERKMAPTRRIWQRLIAAHGGPEEFEAFWRARRRTFLRDRDALRRLGRDDLARELGYLTAAEPTPPRLAAVLARLRVLIAALVAQLAQSARRAWRLVDMSTAAPARLDELSGTLSRHAPPRGSVTDLGALAA